MEVRQRGHWKDLVVNETNASLKLDQCTKAWLVMHSGQHWSILRQFRFILRSPTIKKIVINIISSRKLTSFAQEKES